MKRTYIGISVFSSIILVFLGFVLSISNSDKYATMCSIFIPIIIGAIINYDLKQKEKYRCYYIQLYMYITTYYDILSNKTSKESRGQKHYMMSNLSNELIDFLNKNLKYSSKQTAEVLSCRNIYRYKTHNEFQDNYTINRVVPILLREIIENDSLLNFYDYLKIKFNFDKRLVLQRRALTRLYVNSLLIHLVSEMDYCITLSDTVEYYNIFDNYTSKNSDDIFKIKKYIINNRKLKFNDLVKRLKNNYNVPIRKIKH